MSVRVLKGLVVLSVIVVSCAFCYAGQNNEQLGFAKSVLEDSGKNAELHLVTDMDHREAFRIRTDKGKTIVEAATSAGLIYGAQAVADGEFKLGQVEKPDFLIRGTTLCLMPSGYRATLSPDLYPWFYDKEFAPYKERLGIDNLEQRHCMPVSQYVKALEQGVTVENAMTPDKTAALLNTLAKESLELAGNALQHANHSGVTDENRSELERFVTDSEMYVLATQTMIHKEQAAILKARMLIKPDSKLAGQFLESMEQSVVSYKKLAALTTTTYLHGNDLQKSHWKDSGLKEFENDLAVQKKWLKGFTTPKTGLMSNFQSLN